jgi:hypothetical protein
MAGVFGGGLAPIIATAMIAWSHGASWPVATYLALMALVSLLAVYFSGAGLRPAQRAERAFGAWQAGGLPH